MNPRDPFDGEKASDDDDEFIQQLQDANIRDIPAGSQIYRHNRSGSNSGCLKVIIPAVLVIGVSATEIIRHIL